MESASRSARHRRERRFPRVLVIAAAGLAIAGAAGGFVVSSDDDSPRSDASRTGPLRDVDGTRRACLIADSGDRALETATWNVLRQAAHDDEVIAQRSAAADPTVAINSALARQCDAVVVAGTQWRSPVTAAARVQRDRTFVIVVPGNAVAAGKTNVVTLGYLPTTSFSRALVDATRR